MKTNHNITELNAFFKQVWKDMPNEYKRTMALGCSSIGINLASLAMSGTAKKVTATIGLSTYAATIISALDASKKLLDSIDATTEQINKNWNKNWEEYKASHPEIFGNI